MDDTVPPPGDGDVSALLDDWLSTTPVASVPEEPGATLLAALEADAAAAVIPAEAVDARPEGNRRRYVLFTVAGATYAVPETSVTEVERVPKITLVPRVPAWLRGVASLRGEVLSVLDVRTYLGLEPTSLHTGRLLVVRLTDEELSLGLLVDSVDQIASVTADDVRPPASPLDGALAPYLAGVARVDERLVAALDLDALLHSADVRQFDDRKPE